MNLSPTVHILLASYNGGEYIYEQLKSIAQQSYKNWTLTVSDDGSRDDTIKCVEEFAKTVSQKVVLIHGPKKGATQNFFHLVRQAPSKILTMDLYAYCDQDDVWDDSKLCMAVQWHSTLNFHSEQPALYCGRTRIVDRDLNYVGLSTAPKRRLNINNAILQNISSGNTMVMNARLVTLLKSICPEHSVWHDWTTYQAATACDGIVHFDPQPHLSYRQHGQNVIGANTGFRSQIDRIKPLMMGRYKYWTNQTMAAMQDLDAFISPMARKSIQQLLAIRAESNAFRRVWLWIRSDLRRQGVLANLALAVGLFLGLI